MNTSTIHFATPLGTLDPRIAALRPGAPTRADNVVEAEVVTDLGRDASDARERGLEILIRDRAATAPRGTAPVTYGPDAQPRTATSQAPGSLFNVVA